jgi:hypothetical protein
MTTLRERARRLGTYWQDYFHGDVEMIEAALSQAYTEGEKVGYRRGIEEAVKVCSETTHELRRLQDMERADDEPYSEEWGIGAEEVVLVAEKILALLAKGEEK